jgi:predicted Fe-Mo cluster-binding NifX family protein
MKVAVSAAGDQATALVDQRFGRAPFFQIFEAQSGRLLALLDNSENATGMSGAGIATAQAICAAAVGAVITGQVGPNAHQVLSAAGISIYTGASGTVAEALSAWQAGDLACTAGPDGQPATTRSTGRGLGRGRGGGRRSGRR